ncbi:MAG: sugar ABC transporter permease [Actinomycetales bacterium]|nr:MAG: sugar ABC transporter permease [Actinomycetales bacterium]
MSTATAQVDGETPASPVVKWIKIVLTVGLAVALVIVGASTAGADGWLKLANAVIAIGSGVLGAMALFWVLNRLVEMLPSRWEDRLKPFVFIGPALSAIGLFLVFPAVQTVQGSFYSPDLSEPVGFKNYVELFSDETFISTIVNTLLWTILVPTATVIFGLVVATLTDKLSATSEKYAKMFIFLPMAISLVGSAGIWKLVYDSSTAINPQTGEQTRIGLFNAIIGIFGADQVQWLQTFEGKLNTLFIILVFVWTQVGFAMVLLSAAIKGVPEDTIEAGRIDGASERRIFFAIVIPQIRPTIVTVFVTVLIAAMKVGDLVFAFGVQNFDADVIGSRFITELWTNVNLGKASAIVVVLLVAVIPIVIYQIRTFRREEAIR